GNLEGAVVRQQHGAAAHPDAGRCSSDLGDHDFGSGAREEGCAVMLRHPVGAVAEILGEAGEVDRIPEGLRPGTTFGDRRLVEDGELERPCQGWRILRERATGYEPTTLSLGTPTRPAITFRIMPTDGV